MSLNEILAIFGDLPTHLAMWTQTMGPWIYVLLFAIIFAETGLVVTPILPGDSLLFAVGALTAIDGGLSFAVLAPLLVAAALSGDIANYSIGRWLGPKLFARPNSKLFNPKHLHRTQGFYKKHGGKTIILARFVPIVRTYAPFVAGLGRMELPRYASFCVVGALLWIVTFLSAGRFFGNIPQVKTNFHYVIAAILVISVLPAAFEFLKARREQPAQGESNS